jgi:hypothetical protein
VSQHAPKGPNLFFEGGRGDRLGEGCSIFYMFVVTNVFP